MNAHDAHDLTPGSIVYVGGEVALIAPAHARTQAYAGWALGQTAVAVFVPAAAITHYGAPPPAVAAEAAVNAVYVGGEVVAGQGLIGGEVALIAPDDHGGNQSHAEWALGEPVVPVFVPAAALATEPVA